MHIGRFRSGLKVESERPDAFAPARGLSGPKAAEKVVGFTLLEALIVVSISAIVLGLGVPSFKTTIASNRLTSAANAFVGNYNNARITAIRRNVAVQFCGDGASTNGSERLGTDCGSSAGAVRLLNSDSSSTTVVAQVPTLPPGVTVVSARGLRFNGQGFGRLAVSGTGPYTGLLLDLSSSTVTSNNRRCVYVTTGSIISVCSATGTGACNASEPSSCQ